MDKQEKIKIAITAGIAAVILLILVLVLTLSGSKENTDDQRLSENITDYAEAGVSTADADNALVGGASDSGTEDSTDSAADSGSEASSEASSLASTGSEDKNTANNSVSGNSFYPTGTAALKNVYKGIKIDVDTQLVEMYRYWADNNMDAVRDLAHLDRFEVMSYNLGDSKDFYYYGDKDGTGLPDGTGLAVYANDQYYFGQWSGGKRNGSGTWISFYPDYSNNVVKEHMYSGEWSDDLPYGQGQEHYDYNTEYMNKADIYIQNVIGEFTGGLYNGEMYVITIDSEDNTTEWTGTCNNGTFEQVLYAAVDKKGKIPVLSERLNTDHHLYMTIEGASNNAVRGIITGGSVKGK